MQGIKIVNGEMVIYNKDGTHIISCPKCGEKGKKVDGYYLCPSDDCRVWRFFTG